MGFVRAASKVLKLMSKRHVYFAPRKGNNGNNGQHGINHDFPPGLQRINHSRRGRGSTRRIPYPHPLSSPKGGVYPIKLYLIWPLSACGWIMGFTAPTAPLHHPGTPTGTRTRTIPSPGSQAGMPDRLFQQGARHATGRPGRYVSRVRRAGERAAVPSWRYAHHPGGEECIYGCHERVITAILPCGLGTIATGILRTGLESGNFKAKWQGRTCPR